ncbi:MAG: hypothetical protein WCC60_03660 [Ilumatobacteraceae bacterium]
MTTAPNTGWFSGRTRLITIVSILAVGVAGATAVGANIGILKASSESNVGSTTAGDLTTPNSQVVDVYLPGQAASTTLAPTLSTGIQEFTVDTAGTVAIATTDNGLRLDSANPATGWTWSLAQTSPGQLMVTFTDGTRTLEFTAVKNADGTVAAAVNEPIVTAAPPAPSGGGSYSGDDEYEGGGDDD